jgi:hypothetical protein
MAAISPLTWFQVREPMVASPFPKRMKSNKKRCNPYQVTQIHSI